MKKRITALILGIVMMLSDVCMVSAEDMTPEEAPEMLRNGNTLPSVEDCSLYVDEWYFYTGEPVLPEVRVVTPEGDTLTDGTDYFLRCFGCEDTGTAKAVITGINGWKGSDTAAQLKDCIDSGKRALVVVQYTHEPVTHYSSGTHFIVICGYEYIDGQLYFYYADPYYGEGNRSLRRVDKDTLSTSMDMVKREPRCMIIAEK